MRGFRFSLFFRWYDLWVGAYVDAASRTIYVCLVPMVGLKIVYGGPAWPR